MNPMPPPCRHRRALLLVPLLAAPAVGVRGAEAGEARWQQAALRMRELALGWGDQPYGAVLVKDGRLVGEGPSRVVQRGDPDAHAERVALQDARARFGARALQGAVLYSTSRPCVRCERAAAAAGVARLVHGMPWQDAGAPRAEP